MLFSYEFLERMKSEMKKAEFMALGISEDLAAKAEKASQEELNG